MRLTGCARFVTTVLLLATSASAQIVLHREDFEQGYTHWSMTGMWNPESSSDLCGGQLLPYPTGAHCAYFGNESVCNYDLPGAAHSGALTWLDPIVVPISGHTTLRFWDWRSAECYSSIHLCPWGTQFDKTTVQISTDGGMSFSQLGSVCRGGGTPITAYNQPWGPHVFSLDAYQGTTVHVRFLFETVDNMLNAFFGWAIDDVSILSEAVNVTCVPSFNGCPCGFTACQITLVSCPNSTSRMSEIFATGSASVSQDSLQLLARNLPPTSMVMFVEGSAQTTGSAFGDGLLCMSGPYARLGIVQAQNGEASYPPAGGSPISAVSSIPPGGGARAYQAYYRDAVLSCTSASFNLTGAFQLNWVP